MQVKCDYCGSYIDEKDEFCPQCGAVNAGFNRATEGTPRTINELKAWYFKRNLPPKEVTRFFIGEDYREPKAFGIYEENGEYIVYKNKADGTRAERYRGTDEAYAVNEIYLKLKSEILNQKAHNINAKKVDGKEAKPKSIITTIIGWLSTIALIGCVLGTVVVFIWGIVETIKDIPYAGNYYVYDDDVYYCESYVDDDWYWYDYSNRDYIPVEIPTEMYDDIQSYKFSDDDEWDESIEKFEDTDMGKYIESLHDNSDSDYDWDSSDSWDSDSSDWDSDW